MFRNNFVRQLLLALFILALSVACNPLSPTIVVATQEDSKPAATTTTPARLGTVTQNPPVDSPARTPTSAVHVDAAQLGGLELIFWHPFSGSRQAQLAKMVGRFNRQNEWGIKVHLKNLNGWGEIDEQARSIPLLKEKPDLLVGYNDQVLRWDSGGYLFVELDNYVEDAQWGLTPEERQSFFPAVWAQDYIPDGLVNGKPSPGGRRLGMPWYRSGLFFFYNATWGRELGFNSEPHNPAQLLTQACAAADANRKDADRTNDGTGGWLITPEPGVLAAWIFAYGGEIARPDREGYQFNTPEASEALVELYEFYDAGCAWRELDVDRHRAFADRKALLVADSVVGEFDIDAALDLADNNDEWRLLPFFSPSGEPVVNVSGPSLLVAQTTPERQLASWLFVRWLVSAQNQAEWAVATGFLPVSASAVEILKNANTSPALRQGLPFLAYAHPEPAYASWHALRWSMAEALDQIMTPGLTSKRLNGILESLDKLAAEVHAQIR